MVQDIPEVPLRAHDPRLRYEKVFIPEIGSPNDTINSFYHVLAVS